MADEWLGRAINDYLTERGIKQIFLSQKTGIPKHKICSSLNGKRRFTFEESRDFEQVFLQLGGSRNGLQKQDYRTYQRYK